MLSELDITLGLFVFYGTSNWAQNWAQMQKMDSQQR